MMSALEALCPTARELLAGEIPDVRNSPAMLTVIGRIDQLISNARLRRESASDHDEKLANCVGLLGDIARDERGGMPFLMWIGARVFVWLETFGLAFEEILADVAQERLRQRRLFEDHKLNFRVDSRYVSPSRKLRVLVEEIGEVAEAIDEIEAHPKSPIRRQHLIKELVQVAAVTVAWLESLEAQ